MKHQSKRKKKSRIVPVVPENKRHMLDADGEKCLYCEQSETVLDTDAVCPARLSGLVAEHPCSPTAGPLEKLLWKSRGVPNHCQMCGADSSQHLEPGFTPDGQPKILCQSCLIGSAESLESKRLRLDKNELATILAALRMFQREYEGKDAKVVFADWQEHITDTPGKGQPRLLRPLGTDDIDALCERINFGSAESTRSLEVVELRGALDSLLTQVQQMQGMFDDSDGAIAEAVKAAEEALE